MNNINTTCYAISDYYILRPKSKFLPLGLGGYSGESAIGAMALGGGGANNIGPVHDMYRIIHHVCWALIKYIM